MTLDQEAIQRLLDYDPETGKLRWRERPLQDFDVPSVGRAWNTKYAGKEAFTAAPQGYKMGKIHGAHWLAHRVVWLWMTGELIPGGHIKHRNEDRSDNRWANLFRSPNSMESLPPHHRAWLNAHPNRTEDWFRRMIEDGFDVHHLDGDRQNNAGWNLILVDHGDHQRIHQFQDRTRRSVARSGH